MGFYPIPGERANPSFGATSEPQAAPKAIDPVYLVVREPNHYDDSIDIHRAFVRLSDAQRTAADLNDKRDPDERSEPYIVTEISVAGQYYAPYVSSNGPSSVIVFDSTGDGKIVSI